MNVRASAACFAATAALAAPATPSHAADAACKDLLPTEIARYRKASQEAGLRAE